MTLILQNMAGESVELVLNMHGRPNRVDVETLKKKVADVWQIPPMCQSLFVNGSLLGESSHGDYEEVPCCEEGANLAVTVITSIDGVKHDLELEPSNDDNNEYNDADDDVRCRALEAVAMLGLRGQAGLVDSSNERGIVEIVAALLENANEHIRSRAVAALRSIVDGSGEHRQRVVDAIMPILAVSSEHARCSALEALGHVACRGDETLISSVISMEAEVGQSAGVTCAALKALVALAKVQDANVVALALSRLEHNNAHVRKAAVDLLTCLAKTGDANIKVVNAALKHFVNDDAGIRSAAAMLLGKVAARGDPDVIMALTAQCGDMNWYVRYSAVEALGSIAEIGDDYVITALNVCLEDRDDTVRHKAAEVSDALCVVAACCDNNACSVACDDASQDEICSSLTKIVANLQDAGWSDEKLKAYLDRLKVNMGAGDSALSTGR